MEIEQAFSDLLDEFECETALMQDSDPSTSSEEEEVVDSTMETPSDKSSLIMNRVETPAEKSSLIISDNQQIYVSCAKITNISLRSETDNGNHCFHEYPTTTTKTNEVKYIDENDNIEAEENKEMVHSKVEITLFSQGKEEECLKRPVVVVPLKDCISTSGESAILHCEIKGLPNPTISWRKNGMIVGQTTEFVQTYIGCVATLAILETRVQDAGLYECVANNSFGETFTSSNLIVKESSSTSQKDHPTLDFASNTVELPIRRTGRNLTRTRSSPLTQTSPYDRSSSSDNPEVSNPPTVRSFTRTYSLPAPQLEPCSSTNTPSPPTLIRHPRRTRFSPAGLIGNLIQAKLQNSLPARMVATDESEIKESSSSSQPTCTSPVNVSTSNIVLAPPDAFISPVAGVCEKPADSHGGSSVLSSLTGVHDKHAVSDLHTSSATSQASAVRHVSDWLTELDNQTVSSTGSGMSSGSYGVSSTGYGVSNTGYGVSSSGSGVSSSAYGVSSGGYGMSSAGYGETPKKQAAPRVTRIRRATTNVFPGIKEIPEPVSVAEIKSQNKADEKQPLSMVSRLRMQFSTEDDKSLSKGGGGVRRWRSLPPKKQEEKPSVVVRNLYYLRQQHDQLTAGQTGEAIMPSYEDYKDEEELMKLMNKTDDFDERKKIRSRLRELREQMRVEREEKRLQREKETQDLIKKRHEQAEIEKQKKLQRFKDERPMCDRQDQFMAASQHAIQDKQKVADVEKQKALDAYKQIAAHKETRTHPGGTTTTTTKVEQTPGGGTRTTTVKKSEEVSKTSGFGGMQYSKPGAESTAIHISDQLANASGPRTSGTITVQTESWNSQNGFVQKSQKTESWGAKPAGARGAMAAFKQMDGANNPGAPSKPNALVSVTMAKNVVTRRGESKKKEILEFCKLNTEDYENIQITNFSTSWNNGLAFCALIHHFFPNAFDYSALSPKNRRYNFDLAFDTAEKEADIAPLLDTEDMVKMKNPDWKCVFTYVQSIYRHLRDHDANKAAPSE